MNNIKTQNNALYESANLAVKCMKYISRFLIIGVTEKQIANKIRKYFIDNGATRLSFSSIVAFGENSAIYKHKPTNRQLTTNDCVQIDIGCIYKRYASDITRTFLPKKPSKEMLKIYRLVKKANVQAIKSIKVGMKACELDNIARGIITNAGYGKNFIHELGHTIGKSVWQKFLIDSKNQKLITNNMFFTIEPCIFIPNKFGIKIEDTVHIVNGKVKILTNIDK